MSKSHTHTIYDPIQIGFFPNQQKTSPVRTVKTMLASTRPNMRLMTISQSEEVRA